jgi:hypothetical protein
MEQRTRTQPRGGVRAPPRAERIGLLIIVAVSAAGAAVCSAQPVGTRAADALWCALLGALAPVAGSRASRVALLLTGGMSAVIGIGGDTTAVVASIVLILLVGLTAASRRPNPIVGALIGAIAAQVLLRGPTYGFHGLPTIVAIAALAPVAWSAWRSSPRRSRRVVGWGVGAIVVLIVVVGIGLAVLTLRARSEIQRAASDATAGLDHLAKGEPTEATASFEQSATRFASARRTLDSWISWPGRGIPIAAQNLRALRTASAAGVDLASTAADTAASADYRSLTVDAGHIDLAKIRSLDAPIARSLDTITSALADVNAVRSEWLVAPVDAAFTKLVDRLTQTRNQADVALLGVRAAPALLGGDGTTRYFVSFGSPGESRNGGGLIGAYGILDVNGGTIRLTRSDTITALYRSRPPWYAFDPPTDWQERYGLYNVDRNVANFSASPSWPVDTSVISQLYPQAPGGAPIAGAIYADPSALAGLLSITGPITVPGITTQLNTDNVEQYLLHDQYIEFANDVGGRKDVLGDVARATFDALVSRPLPNLATLGRVLGPLVDAGHLRVSVSDAGGEHFLDQVGVSGDWNPTPGSDVLSVRSANLLTNKIDAFLHRSIDVQTRIDGDTVRSTVTVEMRNDAPPSGLPPYLIGNSSGLPDGTSRTIVTVYSPLALDSVTINGSPTGAQVQQEFGGPTYGVVAEIPAGSTITIRYELVGPVPSRPYRLEVIPQAMANPDHLLVGTGTGASGALRTRYDGVLDHIVNISPIAVS